MEEHNQNHTANLLHNSHDNNNDVRSMLCSHRHLQYIGPCKDVAYVYEPEDEYHCVHQVLDFLFQGSAKASEDNEILAYHKINAIVNGKFNLFILSLITLNLSKIMKIK